MSRSKSIAATDQKVSATRGSKLSRSRSAGSAKVHSGPDSEGFTVNSFGRWFPPITYQEKSDKPFGRASTTRVSRGWYDFDVQLIAFGSIAFVGAQIIVLIAASDRSVAAAARA